MPVTNLFLIGSFTVPSTWIALIAAFILAYIAVRLKFGKVPAVRFGDAVFYVIIIWKLSVILTDFKTVIHSLLAIVYFNGGFVGFILGMVFVIGKTWYDWKKGRLGMEVLAVLFTSAVLVQTVFQVMMTVLNEGSLFVRIGTAVIFIGLAIVVWVYNGRSVVAQFPLLFMAAHIFVASIQPKGLMNPSLFVTILVSLFFIAIFRNQSMNIQTERGSSIE